MNNSSGKSPLPPASERAIKAIAPLMMIASIICMNETTDNQLAHSCLFSTILYLLTTAWAVFDNFDANEP